MNNIFDLEKALSGAPVQTKDGRKVTDIKVVLASAPRDSSYVDEYEGEEYIQGLTGVIHNTSGLDTYPFYHSGVAHKYGLATEADLTTDIDLTFNLLKELKKIPVENHKLDIYFKIEHLTGNLIHIDSVTTEIFKFIEESEGVDTDSYHQVVNLRSMDFVENSYAETLNKEDRLVEQLTILKVGELLELLELSINREIPVIAYSFLSSSKADFESITKMEKSTSMFFGKNIDCYIIS